MKRSNLIPTQLDPTVMQDGTLTVMLVTPCCGSRLYRELGPSICPMCGEVITLTGTVRQEKYIDPTNFGITRYWS